MDQAARLADWFDRQEIVDVQDRYWLGIANHDIEMVVATFAPDGIYGAAVGHRAIREHLRALDDLTDCIVTRGPGSIDIEGDRAISLTWAVAFLTTGEGTRRRHATQGLCYHDEWVRLPDGWRIASRRSRADPRRVHDNPWQTETVTGPVCLD